MRLCLTFALIVFLYVLYSNVTPVKRHALRMLSGEEEASFWWGLTHVIVAFILCVVSFWFINSTIGF